MKDPAFLLYYQDFLVGTYFMSNDCVGAYIRCLCHQAHNWTISEKDMIKICQSHEIHTEVKSKFLIDDNDEYYNERLREEITKRKKYSQSRSENRKSTGRKSQSDSDVKLKSSKKESVKDVKNICHSYERHMEDENEELSLMNKDEITVLKKEESYSEITEQGSEISPLPVVPAPSEVVLVNPHAWQPDKTLTECKAELLKSQSWLEQVTMNKRLASIRDTEVWLIQFFSTLAADGITHKGVADAKKHFNRWLGLQIQNKTTTNANNKSTTSRQDEAIAGFSSRLEARNNAFLARQQQESD